jgi:LPXTG-motif cell wall-anchored protein
VSNKHVEEQDGCDHGRTGRECRPDPSPNGKDCEVHGQHGGVNEDHCLSTTTTTTAPPTTATTSGPVVSPTTTSTTPSTATTSSSATTTSTMASPSFSTMPTTTTSVTAVVDVPVPLSELPHTGAGTDLLASLGFGMLALGLWLRSLRK